MIDGVLTKVCVDTVVSYTIWHLLVQHFDVPTVVENLQNKKGQCVKSIMFEVTLRFAHVTPFSGKKRKTKTDFKLLSVS